MSQRHATAVAAFLLVLSAVGTPFSATAHPKPIAPDSTSAADGGTNGGPSNPTGYIINRQGFGNYVPGRNGSFGGYPAGSAGAKELQLNQEQKCRNVPETC